MAEPTVFIVDDHAGVRDSIAELVDSVGLRHATFASAQQFLDAFDPEAPGCLVLDVRMAHMSGPALQEHLATHGRAGFRSCSSAATPTSTSPSGRSRPAR